MAVALVVSSILHLVAALIYWPRWAGGGGAASASDAPQPLSLELAGYQSPAPVSQATLTAVEHAPAGAASQQTTPDRSDPQPMAQAAMPPPDSGQPAIPCTASPQKQAAAFSARDIDQLRDI
ncbi:MAG: hypothetical protein V2J89_04210, partial [Halieaceae bacterium]|nr:hypothetical protein [Halieaceae bacterium]